MDRSRWAKFADVAGASRDPNITGARMYDKGWTNADGCNAKVDRLFQWVSNSPIDQSGRAVIVYEDACYTAAGAPPCFKPRST